MFFSLDDTIAAIASAPGGAARGIVRISGPSVLTCLKSLLDQETLPVNWAAAGHTTALSAEFQWESLRLRGDLLFWPGTRSYTGQPAAEIHTFGCGPLLEHLLQGIRAAGARLAEPGEFTLRAFLSGRIDLTQAEGVLGAIEASNPGQLDAALMQLAGGLADPLRRLRQMLLELLAHLEAGFDFADEDLPFLAADQLDRQLRMAGEEIDRLVRRMAGRAESRPSVRVVLTGRPNAGKSSLFNVLAGDAAAIVSSTPGTTRDYLAVDLELDGTSFRLIDTAGFEQGAVQTSDPIGRAAGDLAQQQRDEADVLLVCVDGACETAPAASEDSAGGSALCIVVQTKADLHRKPVPGASLVTSARTGKGTVELKEAICRAVRAASVAQVDVVVGTAVRCHGALCRASESLHRALELAGTGEGEELVAAEIRIALDALGRVVGAVYTDELLDEIFSRFCVGK